MCVVILAVATIFTVWTSGAAGDSEITVTITQRVPIETISLNGQIIGVREATVGTKLTWVGTDGSQLTLQDAQGTRYRIVRSATDYTSPATTIPSPTIPTNNVVQTSAPVTNAPPVSAVAENEPKGPTLSPSSNTPALDETYESFYTKQIDAGGIIIRAHRDVSDNALREAQRRIDTMLMHLATVRVNLGAAGAELHIIGKNQAASDLPENRSFKGMTYDGASSHGLTFDQRLRGQGGLLTSCGEENLLRLPEDRYYGEDILSHEFAHNILRYGVTTEFRKQVEQRYHASLGSGKWVKAYAATNPDEFFAELSMWYFGTHGDFNMIGEKPDVGPEGLRKYDPESFALLDDFYQGKISIPESTVLPVLPIVKGTSLRSKIADTPSMMIFRNKTSQTLLIFWIVGDGQRVANGVIAPHFYQGRPTVASQAWVCVNERGKDVAFFLTLPGNCIANINELEPEEAP